MSVLCAITDLVLKLRTALKKGVKSNWTLFTTTSFAAEVYRKLSYLSFHREKAAVTLCFE